MTAHAVLGPSSASRWLTCTPSARLELQFPDTAGVAAQEGTLAHSLGELLIRKKTGGFNLTSKDPKANNKEYLNKLAAIKADKLYSEAMLEYMDTYATFVLEQFAEVQAHTKDAILLLEQRLDLSEFVPEGFGTGDVIIIADGLLTIIDLKYGKGVPVSATENKQMMLYGLGALIQHDHIYDIDAVRMIIYQPRLDSVSAFEMKADHLKSWGEVELKPRAAMAFAGEGEFVPGLNCRFCKAKGICKANAQFNLEIARHDFKEPVLLTDGEVTDILNRADQFEKWVKSVKEYALYEAVKNGKQWPDYKLVAGKSNRAYADPAKIEEKLLADGFKYSEITKPKELLPLGEMEKLLGKTEFTEKLGDLIVKPSGKPTLVPKSDKRPEYGSVQGAVLDFADETDN